MFCDHKILRVKNILELSLQLHYYTIIVKLLININTCEIKIVLKIHFWWDEWGFKN